MQLTSLGFETDIAIRRLAGGSIEDREDLIVVRTPARPTYHWGNFVLVPTPHGYPDVERWRQSFEEEHPGAAHISIGVDATGPIPALEPAASAAALTLDITNVLVASRLIAPEHPNTHATCRALGDKDWDAARAVRASVAADQGHTSTEYRRFLHLGLEEIRDLCSAGHAAYFGAFVAGELRAHLGIVAVGRGFLRYQHVETHPAHRRLGLAGTLVHAAASAGSIRFPDARRLVIVADPGGPAISLYRSLGFLDAEQHLELSGNVGE